MIDLSGVAHQLHLSVEQIRIAADLLQKGYQPAFIQQYRADETGNLSRDALWALKLEIDRQQRLATARVRLSSQLPKDAELDEEAKKFIEKADTELGIESALRAFRARRSLETGQGTDPAAGQLLEKMVAYEGQPIADLQAWTAEQLGVTAEEAEAALQKTEELIGALLLCDTGLMQQLRQHVQRKAQIRVELLDGPQSGNKESKKAEAKADAKEANAESRSETPAAETPAPTENSQSPVAEQVAASPGPADSVATTAEVQATENAAAQDAAPEVNAAELAEASEPVASDADQPSSAEPAAIAETQATSESPQSEPTDDQGANAAQGDASAPAESATTEAGDDAPQPATEDAAAEKPADAPEAGKSDEVVVDWAAQKKAKSSSKLAKKSAGKKESSRQLAKLTPRQRRRRWLIAMLTPMKGLKKPLSKLSAYQLLMLGRGHRSQIVKTHLQYDAKTLTHQGRDRFVSREHPLSKWFARAVTGALESSVRQKIENDAIAELEEQATEKLLSRSVDGLRRTLLQRPVRGHRVMVVDTVGPKVAAVAIVDQSGNVLANEEIPCSALAETVTQNVTRLGELVHKYKVTLVALTNGPARRFLVHTLRELINQSSESGLRWTMADRSGADAYAAGRISLRELSAFNRRDRAAVWVARSLQDPLLQYLKVGINRLRLGSFQRELPQEPLKKLVRETIADCVAGQGVDVHSASVSQLLCVPGIHDSQAQQIATMAAQGTIESRQQLIGSVDDWTETQSRQAIGMLRVFGSDETFDATNIHPDDYKLAQRLVDGTELEKPPAAPPNWEKPAPVSAEEAANIAAGDHADESSSDENPDSDSTTTEATSESFASEPTETAAEQGTATSTEAESAADENAVAETSQEQPETTSDSESSDGAITEQTETVTSEPTEGEATAEETAEESSEQPASDPAEAVTDAEPESGTESSSDAEAAPEPAEGSVESKHPKPEYSEDVATTGPAKLPIDVEKLARGWQVGRERLKSIAHALNEPFADVRLGRSPVPMRSQMPTLDNLEPGQCLWAVVVGVADFGAFVELGPDCGGLIHISRLSSRYVDDPHEVVQVGDLIMTWVVSIDKSKGRVALTTLSPAEAEAARTEDSGRGRRGQSDDRGQGGRRGGGQSRGQGGGQQRGQRSGGQRGQGGQGRGQGSSGGGRPGGGRPGDRSSGGGRGDSRGGNRGRGRDGGRDSRRSRGDRPAKSVVVTSKKPVDPISSAMKEGEEPLRSFSDLMQFYEAKRTDEPAPGESAGSTPPATDSAATSSAENSSQSAELPVDQPAEQTAESTTPAPPSPAPEVKSEGSANSDADSGAANSDSNASETKQPESPTGQ